MSSGAAAVQVASTAHAPDSAGEAVMPGTTPGAGSISPAEPGPTVVFTMESSPTTPRPGTTGVSGNGADLKEKPKKTVRLPGSLTELHQAAASHLQGCTGNKLATSRMRLFHKGREMQHPAHVSDLRDGDEVIIRLDHGRAPLQGAGHKLVSTHQAHYVRHLLKPQEPRPVDTSTVTDQLKQGLLEGSSCYMKDYVKHQVARRPGTGDNHALYATHFLKQANAEGNNKSTYAAHFPWHTAKPTPPAGNDAESAVSDAMRGHRFEGKSSYAEDFGKRSKPAYAAKACGNDSASTLTDDQFRSPFDAKSQYSQDFIQYNMDCRLPSARPRPSTPDEQRFAGMSEYRHQYVGKEAKPPLVHLLVDS